MVSVRWSHSALETLEQFDPTVRERILGKVSWLRDNFGETAPRRLKRDLKGFYKLRIGDYRIVYSIHANEIVIEDVGHRSDIYKP